LRLLSSLAKRRSYLRAHVLPSSAYSLPFAFIYVYDCTQNGVIKMLRAVIKNAEEIPWKCHNATVEQDEKHGTGKACYDKMHRASR